MGYLSMSGEHRSNHPRVKISGQEVVQFNKNTVILTFGVAHKLGFALVSFQVSYIP